jgi:hypothetical protein
VRDTRKKKSHFVTPPGNLNVAPPKRAREQELEREEEEEKEL